MSGRTSIAVVLSIVAGLTAAACKKDKPAEPGPGTGTASGSAPAPMPPVGQGPRASQGPLPTMPALTYPDDPKRAEKVALGHALFFDKRLSVDGTRACYSCHLNEDGNGGHDPIAIGPGEKKLTRHSPVMWNVAYFDQVHALYWDGRAKNLEAQANGALGGGNMGIGTEPEKLEAKAAEMAAIAGYKPLFAAAFPDAKAIKIEHVNSALAEYMRTMICKDTAYDKFAAGDKSALTEPQQRGLDVFMGERGQCNICHAPPYFSTAMATPDGFYANVGIGTQKPEAEVDIGRKKISNKDEDWAAFKVPSLRNVRKSPPYFHDGSIASLDEAVAVMAAGGIPNPKKSPLAQDRKLTPEELADLVAFLGALDCGSLEEPELPK